MTHLRADDQQAPQPYRLTDLAAPDHARHGVRRRRGRLERVVVPVHRWLRFAQNVLPAFPKDVRRWLRPPATSIRRMEAGLDARLGARSVALYIHYARSGQVSAMVLRQLAGLAAEGFAILFITMAEHVPDADWQAMREHCALVVQRRNYGLDFGGWRDLAPEAARCWPAAEEMLLVNDSVLGPIRSMSPVLAALRGGGPGLFGLTESIQGGPHLQSYFLLAHGRAAITDLQAFLTALRLSAAKTLVIRRGELRLSDWMRQRGHRTAALFGYQRVIAAVLEDPRERELLVQSHRLLHRLAASSEVDLAALLREPLLNPTHHLWQVLVRQFGFPFLKTELVQRNPLQLPGVEDWRALVPTDMVPLLEAHLAMLAEPEPSA